MVSQTPGSPLHLRVKPFFLFSWLFATVSRIPPRLPLPFPHFRRSMTCSLFLDGFPVRFFFPLVDCSFYGNLDQLWLLPVLCSPPLPQSASGLGGSRPYSLAPNAYTSSLFSGVNLLPFSRVESMFRSLPFDFVEALPPSSFIPKSLAFFGSLLLKKQFFALSLVLF